MVKAPLLLAFEAGDWFDHSLLLHVWKDKRIVDPFI
jgi:hypothetical protein